MIEHDPTKDLAIMALSDAVVVYPGSRGRGGRMTALDSVSLEVGHRQTVSIVGESGSGKSTLGRVVLGLQRLTSGSVMFRGQQLHRLSKRERSQFRREVQVVFQDPGSSLNPRKSVLSSIGTGMVINGVVEREQATRRVEELLEIVGLTPARSFLTVLPDELSGGQKQRVAFARAISLGPKLIVADEALSALDASLQAQILVLMRSLQEQLGLSYLFISHDLDTVAAISDQICVMQSGRVVERGTVADVFDHPNHDYTRKLLDARLIPSF
ncbi:ABC transporter ATP-binding protein [Nakamurella leprariae]|uniref:ABC transporter ATP-binding protein n=1 Tax=Nakamurella leprariae TaxID=2803911 RepID=A0A938YGN2_9ACTN|nr:ATP-binding cassette domain-containing protein [Nakamurella leprariae]MBM9467478.1 ABC transporter ATP-binding protein [Nakamurella leprariae]